MIHAVDWYPTLLGLAGGTAGKEADGVNQWEAISKNKANVRTKLVYNIYDKKVPRGAVRVGDYKLIVGKGGEPSGWYPPPDLFKIDKRSWSSTIVAQTNNSLQLYNVKVDPLELNEISAKYPKIVSRLWKEFKARAMEMVPADEPANNPRGSPKFFQGVFTPGWCNATF